MPAKPKIRKPATICCGKRPRFASSEQLNSPRYALGRVFRRDARAVAGFMRLSRSEMMLDRVLHRSLRALRELQAPRPPNQKEQNEPTETISIGESRSQRLPDPV